MPTLPTFDVTAAQATRIQNALAPGGTQAQAAEVIRKVYKRALIKAEAAQAERDFVAQRDAAAKAFSDEINPPPPPPTPPPPDV